MLARARLVDPEHPGLGAMQTQLSLLSRARVHELKLDTAATRQRSNAVAAELRTFGAFARSPLAWVTVRAGTDAEGRWMFQQLNRSNGTRTIRGDIIIGRPPLVRVLVLPLDDPADPGADPGPKGAAAGGS